MQKKALAAEADVAKLAADLDDLRQTLLRRQADFDNYRKRIEKERFEDGKRATARVIEALIPTVDSFEHALAAHREAEYENYRKGFELIYKQLLENLTKLGVERIDPLGKQFDPHQHQAVDRAETTDARRRYGAASFSAGIFVQRACTAARDGACSRTSGRRIEDDSELTAQTKTEKQGMAKANQRDFYEVLGVSKTATVEEIKVRLPQSRAEVAS